MTKTGTLVRIVCGIVVITSEMAVDVTTVEERQVGSAPAVVLKASQRVVVKVTVLPVVESSFDIEVDTETVEIVVVVKSVSVGVGVHAAILPADGPGSF